MTSFYVKTFLAAGKVVQVFPDVFPTKYGWFTRLGLTLFSEKDHGSK